MDGIGGHLAWKNLVRLCDFAHEYAARSRNLTPKLFVSGEMREERQRTQTEEREEKRCGRLDTGGKEWKAWRETHGDGRSATTKQI